MALTLCPNCRLPVNTTAANCHLCSAPLTPTTSIGAVPVAAALALVATLAMLAKRRT